ncbi:JDVT-CTERM domain-containing protein [Propionivibrio sp.]|uniref:JDVT-CTERM domain-containing protein n=1 Tax=Propionivibrio sp. TaxID=2212460 RepID=UPI003BEFEA16
MKTEKKFRFKHLAVASTLALSVPILGHADILYGDFYESWMAGTTNYDQCLTNYTTKSGKSGQQNDACWMYYGASKFFNGNATAPSKGVTVWIDQGHYNFHRIDDKNPTSSKDGDAKRYIAFAKLLENDGYAVDALRTTFTWVDANNDGVCDGGTLCGKKVLVIANPLHLSDTPETNWVDPIYSAYTPDEIAAIKNWVSSGGSLMLIADHYPFPGSVADLGAAFGFTQDNGYNFDPNYNDVFLSKLFNNELAQRIMRQVVKSTDPSPAGGTVTNAKTGAVSPRTVKDDLVDVVRQVMVALGAEVNSLLFWSGNRPNTISKGYAYGDGWLADHPITRGRAGFPAESIPYATSFTGQSFKYAETSGQTCAPLMQLGEGTYSLLPPAQDAYFGVDSSDSENNMVTEALTNQKMPKYTAGFLSTANTAPRTDCNGYLQGAAITRGTGKVVLFGEAGMFTAQIAADMRSQMGFSNVLAGPNQQFVLNTLHWLDGATLSDSNKASTAATNVGLSGSLLAQVENSAQEKVFTMLYNQAKKANINDPLSFANQYKAALVTKYKDSPCALEGIAFKCPVAGVLPDAMSAEIDALVLAAQKTYGAEYVKKYDGAGTGSGCSIGNGDSKDPTLPILAFLAAAWLGIKRRRAS